MNAEKIPPDAADWLGQTVSSVLAAIPRNHPVDLHAIGAVVLLRASQIGIPVTASDTEAAIVAACLAQNRTVEF